MRRLICVAVAAVCAASTVAAAPPVPAATSSLCSPAERTVFSCSTGHKTIALCASPDLSPSTGTLQYRYGAPGKTPELSYPHQAIHPSKAFRGLFEGSAHASTTALGFDIGQFSYSVFSTSSAYGYNGAGVVIGRGGQRVRALLCTSEPPSGEALHDAVTALGIQGGPVDYIGSEYTP